MTSDVTRPPAISGDVGHQPWRDTNRSIVRNTQRDRFPAIGRGMRRENVGAHAHALATPQTFAQQAIARLRRSPPSPRQPTLHLPAKPLCGRPRPRFDRHLPSRVRHRAGNPLGAPGTDDTRQTECSVGGVGRKNRRRVAWLAWFASRYRAALSGLRQRGMFKARAREAARGFGDRRRSFSRWPLVGDDGWPASRRHPAVLSGSVSRLLARGASGYTAAPQAHGVTHFMLGRSWWRPAAERR
jgi:hypothetical protein